MSGLDADISNRSELRSPTSDFPSVQGILQFARIQDGPRDVLLEIVLGCPPTEKREFAVRSLRGCLKSDEMRRLARKTSPQGTSEMIPRPRDPSKEEKSEWPNALGDAFSLSGTAPYLFLTRDTGRVKTFLELH